MNRKSTPITKEDQELLSTVGRAANKAENDLRRIRAERRALVLRVAATGASDYAIAKHVGLARSHIGRIIKSEVSK